VNEDRLSETKLLKINVALTKSKTLESLIHECPVNKVLIAIISTGPVHPFFVF
jgi:hypothetical protein